MRRFTILELFSNPEYRVELSVLLFLVIGLSITILVHQITLGGVEDLLESDSRSAFSYDINLEELEALEDDLVKIKADLNSFVISGNPNEEKAIRVTILKTNKRLARIKEHLSGDASENEKFNNLNQFVRQKIIFSEAVLRRYNTNKQESAISLLNNPWDKQLMDSVLYFSGELRYLQQNNIKQNIESHQKFLFNARRVEFITTIIVFAIVSISILYLIRETSQRLNLQMRLASAKEEAERSAQIKEQFMANMSHEIRTPLNAILGFTNLLKNTPLNTRQQEYVDSMHYSGENLLAIVNDILDLSKMEAGMMKMEEIPFDFKELIHSLENLFRYRAEEKGIDFQVHLQAEIPQQLVGDPVRLTQILTNVLNNAIKFTDQGEVILRIQATSTEELAQIHIEVQDTGIGISKNQLKQIFERFNQANAATTRKYGGAGLGLTIVKRLVELLNGVMQVESSEGTGTIFSLELPYRLASTEEKAQMQRLLHTISFEKPAYKDARILMVEDNPMNRRVMELMLTAWNIEIDQVENGRLALEYLKQTSYDLILMDIQMPELDGYQTTRTIRNRLRLKTPIVAMTAHTLPGEREKCLRYGMNDYLSKPLVEKELYRVVTRFLPIQKNVALPVLQLDMAYLQEISRGENAYLEELAHIFLEHLPKEQQALQQAFEKGDIRNLQKIAHGMRSTVGYIGLAESLGALLRQLEEETNESDIAALMQQVQQQCEEAMTLVKNQLVNHDI